MNIAYLGWGSLIWDSRELNIPEKEWQNDGPFLPIEFVRISNNGRVTLVIDKASNPLPVLWAIAKEKSVNDATQLLAKREGPTDPKNMASVNSTEITSDPVKKTIIDWLRLKGLDAAVWTNLSYKAGKRPSVGEVIDHIRSLDKNTLLLAETYIRKAPLQIMTPYRKQITETFNWM